MTLTELSLEAFANKLASADPTPGGGSVSAAVGAFGAGLIRMVALLTSNAPKFARVADKTNEIAARADILLKDLLSLADEDARSFDAVSAAYRLPKASDSEQQARSNAIQAALEGAIGPPLRVIAAARAICDLAMELIDIGNPSAITDVGCAVLCAQAAAQGAALNVAINANSLKDRAVAEHHTAEFSAGLAHVNLLAEVVLGKVRLGVGA